MQKGRVGCSPCFQFSWKDRPHKKKDNMKFKVVYAKPKQGLALCAAAQ